MKRTILVADDDQAILEVVEIILKDNGYDVFVVNNPEGIEEAITTHNPSLLFLDIWIGNIDGGTITKQLKSNPETAALPIVILSANTSTEQIAKEAGANDFLLKPFDIDNLLRMVKKYIDE